MEDFIFFNDNGDEEEYFHIKQSLIDWYKKEEQRKEVLKRLEIRYNSSETLD